MFLELIEAIEQIQAGDITLDAEYQRGTLVSHLLPLAINLRMIDVVWPTSKQIGMNTTSYLNNQHCLVCHFFLQVSLIQSSAITTFPL
jgi:hypothetical protein